MEDIEKINDALNALNQIFQQVGHIAVDINGLLAISEILNELKAKAEKK